jgi:hypothetical protein
MSKKTAKKSTSKPAETGSAAIETLYNELKDEYDTDVISMEGIGKLCEKIDIDPSSDVRSLVLVWKMGANTKPGQISKQEFSDGMRALGLNDVCGLKAHLPALDPGFLDKAEFRGSTHCYCL